MVDDVKQHALTQASTRRETARRVAGDVVAVAGADLGPHCARLGAERENSTGSAITLAAAGFASATS